MNAGRTGRDRRVFAALPPSELMLVEEIDKRGTLNLALRAVIRDHVEMAFGFEQPCKPVPLVLADPGGGPDTRSDCRLTARLA